MPAPPEDFVALQVSRLNEALLVAYGAMSAENLRAVALVVRIVRELDRYHGFLAAHPRPRRDLGAMNAEPQAPRALAGDTTYHHCIYSQKVSRRPRGAAPEREQVLVPKPAEDVEAPAAPLVDRPETAPQALEKMESQPEKGAVPNARQAAPQEAGNPLSGPAPAAPCAGAQTATQATENIESERGSGRNPAVAGPTDGASPQAEAFAAGWRRCAGGGAARGRRRPSAPDDGENGRRGLDAGGGFPSARRLQTGEDPHAAQRHGGMSRRRPPVPLMVAGDSRPDEGDQPRLSSLKKSAPLSSTTIKAGKFSTSIRQTASMPSSGYSSTSTFLMQSWASRAAGPPIEPR